jgi:hypothetical protein
MQIKIGRMLFDFTLPASLNDARMKPFLYYYLRPETRQHRVLARIMIRLNGFYCRDRASVPAMASESERSERSARIKLLPQRVFVLKAC